MKRPLKILVVASEVTPFAKTGGLAEVCGSLPTALKQLGHDVRVLMPHYRGVERARGPVEPLPQSIKIPLGSKTIPGTLSRHELAPGLPVYFVGNAPFFNRDFLYGSPESAYPDNAARFIFLCRAVFEACKALDFKPDILHASDWQTGLVPVYLKTLYSSDPFFKKTRSVFSLHNLGYQGNFWHLDVPLAGLPWEMFTPEGVEFFGEFSFLKSGLMFADQLTTVSRTYAREILKPEQAFRMEGVLNFRKHHLTGIVNGIDMDQWNPNTDAHLPRQFNRRSLKGKKLCREDLIQQFDLTLQKGAPLYCLLTRLARQKGIDLIMQAMEFLLDSGAGLVVLGSGDADYEHYFRSLAGDQVGVHIGFDEPLAHQMLAGSDILLMPSVYEPCGLTQMQAMRYGTVPLVSAVGGLKDTVTEFSIRTGKGLGFKFHPYGLQSFKKALKKARKTFSHSTAWTQVMKNGMAGDFSWDRAAVSYERVYRKALRR